MTGGSRDDMVLRPQIAQNRSTTKAAAERQRSLTRAVGRSSAFGRVTRRLAKGLATRAVAGRAIGLPAGRGPMVHPVVALLAIAGLVTLRLATDKPLEDLGRQFERAVFGDMPAEGAAKFRVRQTFEGNPAYLQKAGAVGITTGMTDVGDRLYKQFLVEEKGKRAINEAFPVNGTIDMLILRLRDVVLAAWNGSGGPQTMTDLRNQIRVQNMGGIYK